MANLSNMDAEIGANFIGDDAQPAMTFQQIGSTGPGLRAYGFVNYSTASIDRLEICGGLATESAITVKRAAVGSMSIGILKVVGNSCASGAILEFSNGAFASITSVVLTSVANTDYAIRVQVGLETRWIPLFKDAALVGTAAVG